MRRPSSPPGTMIVPASGGCQQAPADARSDLPEDEVLDGIAVDDESGHAVLRVPLKDGHRKNRRTGGKMVFFIRRQAYLGQTRRDDDEPVSAQFDAETDVQLLVGVRPGEFGEFLG